MLLFIFLMLTTACSISTGKFENIKLPGNATVEDANKIVYTVINSDFESKIVEKFPNWNPQEHIVYVKASKVVKASNPENLGVYLIVGIKHKGDLKNTSEILRYSKLLVEKEIAEYFLL